MSLLACSSSPTQVIVEIDADEAVRELTRSLSIDIAARGLGDDGFQSVQLLSALAPADAWPLQHVLTPANGDANRTYRLSVSALDTVGQVVVRARVISAYIADETRVLRVYLEATCLRRSCDDDETCSGGICVATPFIEPTLLPPPGGPVADAGVDAMDSSTDAVTPPTCEGAGDACTLESAPCVIAHIVCDGELSRCTPDEGSPIDAGLCGEAEGLCSAPSICSPTGTCIPQTQTDNTPCGEEGGVCSAGVCTQCGDPCSIPGSCALGELMCDEGAATCVPTDSPQNDTFACRPAAGPCDAPELCDGANLACPEDRVREAGDVCGELSRGGCDADDVCNGLTTACVNAVQPAGTICRGAPGDVCNPVEMCDGAEETCPSDTFIAAGMECRGTPAGSNTTCDPAEFCQPSAGAGSATECPTDTNAIDLEGNSCILEGATEEGICVADGSCVEDICGEPCTLSGRPCMQAEYVCSSGSPVCTLTSSPQEAGFECGNADPSNPCDLVDECDGAGTCVARVRADDVVCGDAPSGPCAAPPRCQAGSCSNRFQPSTTVCRSADECVLRQLCSGTSAQCDPSNASTSTTCGDSGPCTSQTCDGAGACGPATFSSVGSACMITTQICRVGMCNASGSCEAVLTPGAGCPGGTCSEMGACVSPLVISEVSFRSGASGSILELYNTSANEASVDGCRIRYQAPSGSFGNINLSGVVAGNGFYSVGQGSPDTDALVNINSAASVRLLCSTRIIDTVGWGNSGDVEGARLPTAIFGQSFERKACPDSMLADMVSGGGDAQRGNRHDTNNNAADFVIRTSAGIQDSGSSLETMACTGSGG